MMDIRFVYFDLGNILVSFDPALACRNLASAAGISPEQAQQAVYESGLQDAFESGKLDAEEYWRDVLRLIGRTEAELPKQRLLDAISDMFTPINSMVSVVNHARQRVARIGLLSNTCSAHWDWVRSRDWPVSQLEYDTTILSYVVGAMKPDAQIYDAAEREAQVPPEQILFIDDKQENVDAATERGWHARRCLGGDQAWGIIRDLLG